MVFMGISVVSPKYALPHVTDLSDSMAANALRGPSQISPSPCTAASPCRYSKSTRFSTRRKAAECWHSAAFELAAAACSSSRTCYQLWTIELSLPDIASPHVTTDPSARDIANAAVV